MKIRIVLLISLLMAAVTYGTYEPRTIHKWDDTAEKTARKVDPNEARWNLAYSWGDHSLAGYLKGSAAETDPCWALWYSTFDNNETDPCYALWYSTFDNNETDPCYALWYSTFDNNETDPCYALWYSTFDNNETDPCYALWYSTFDNNETDPCWAVEKSGYQPADDNLTAIAALTETGYVRKTGATTFDIDANAGESVTIYYTSVTPGDFNSLTFGNGRLISHTVVP